MKKKILTKYKQAKVRSLEKKVVYYTNMIREHTDATTELWHSLWNTISEIEGITNKKYTEKKPNKIW